MASTETIREIQTLVGGRNTSVVDSASIVAANGQPDGDVGFTVDSVINAFIGVQLHAVAGRCGATITIGTVVEDATYEINFDSLGATTYTALAGDDADDVAAALVAAAGSTYGSIGTLAAATGGRITMLGVDNDPYTVSASAGAGGSISAVREATSVVWRRWVRFPGSSAWLDLMDSERTDTRNTSERHIVSGIARVYIEIVSTDGAVIPSFARCLPE